MSVGTIKIDPRSEAGVANDYNTQLLGRCHPLVAPCTQLVTNQKFGRYIAGLRFYQECKR